LWRPVNRSIDWPARPAAGYASAVNLDRYCSVADAAKAAGISTAYVRLLLARGQLRGEKIGRAWLVLREDVARFVRIGRGPAPPPPAARPRPPRPRGKPAKRRRK